MPARLGIVTGLVSEARCLRPLVRDGAAVRVAAGDPARAADCAGDLLAGGCSGLVSYGIAGSLAADVAPGRLILPRRILSVSGESYAVALRWRDRLAAMLSRAFEPLSGDLLGVEDLVASPADKRRLADETGALAVDMESLAVARVAARAAVPFIAIRAVADPAGRAPPAWAVSVIADDGGVRFGAALTDIGGRPGRWGEAWTMAGDSRAALKTLRGVAARAGPGFGL